MCEVKKRVQDGGWGGVCWFLDDADATVAGLDATMVEYRTLGMMMGGGDVANSLSLSLSTPGSSLARAPVGFKV